MNYTRPFNIEHARIGAPYACRNGMDTKILTFDRQDALYPLVGLCGPHDTVMLWSANGQATGKSEFDLVMTPLGQLDGRPVFLGDELQHREIAGMRTFASTIMNFASGEWCWPEPVKRYPETEMCDEELLRVWCKKIGDTAEVALTAIANAALRSAIDAGQVLLPKAVAARDLQIAAAVREHARQAASMQGDRVCNAIAGLDLAAIIAEVQAERETAGGAQTCRSSEKLQAEADHG